MTVSEVEVFTCFEWLFLGLLNLLHRLQLQCSYLSLNDLPFLFFLCLLQPHLLKYLLCVLFDDPLLFLDVDLSMFPLVSLSLLAICITTSIPLFAYYSLYYFMRSAIGFITIYFFYCFATSVFCLFYSCFGFSSAKIEWPQLFLGEWTVFLLLASAALASMLICLSFFSLSYLITSSSHFLSMASYSFFLILI